MAKVALVMNLLCGYYDTSKSASLGTLNDLALAFFFFFFSSVDRVDFFFFTFRLGAFGENISSIESGMCRSPRWLDRSEGIDGGA